AAQTAWRGDLRGVFPAPDYPQRGLRGGRWRAGYPNPGPQRQTQDRRHGRRSVCSLSQRPVAGEWARVKTEVIIDQLWELTKGELSVKPRTYRRVAHKRYL